MSNTFIYLFCLILLVSGRVSEEARTTSYNVIKVYSCSKSNERPNTTFSNIEKSAFLHVLQDSILIHNISKIIDEIQKKSSIEADSSIDIRLCLVFCNSHLLNSEEKKVGFTQFNRMVIDYRVYELSSNEQDSLFSILLRDQIPPTLGWYKPTEKELRTYESKISLDFIEENSKPIDKKRDRKRKHN